MRRSSLLIWLCALAASGCVQELTPARGCSLDADCAVDERCIGGACERSELPPLGSDCTLDDEAERCGIGSYCADGHCAELPACADAASCPDGLVCNEGTAACVRAPDCADCCTAASCDDGRFCNGVEVCDAASGQCQPGVPVCAGAAPVCDEATRTCRCGDDDDCVAPERCSNGVCGCTPACDGKQCGDDGCGGTCGSCAAGDECNAGLCGCVPDCDGRQCGSDGCDGSCGACAGADVCDDGSCVCVPDCAGRVCGDDGCGGSCGECPSGTCSPSGQCNCVPDCAGRECGDDGCGGSCGSCSVGACGLAGTCDCTPDCAGRECGDDGCGGSCGACGPHQQCPASGQCQNTGVICDVLTDTITQDEYQARSGFLTAGFDAQYEWDGRPHRYLDNYPLVVPANTSVVVELSSTDFDPTLYVYNVAGGSCVRVAKDDDSAGNLNASLAVTLGSGDYHLVATTYSELDTGEYRIATSTDLCGLTVTQTVYDRCRAKALANNCSNNPCVDYGNSPDFCCVTANCRTDYVTGDEIKIFQSAAVCTP